MRATEPSTVLQPASTGEFDALVSVYSPAGVLPKPSNVERSAILRGIQAELADRTAAWQSGFTVCSEPELLQAALERKRKMKSSTSKSRSACSRTNSRKPRMAKQGPNPNGCRDRLWVDRVGAQVVKPCALLFQLSLARSLRAVQNSFQSLRSRGVDSVSIETALDGPPCC